jgi:hypothetical protein
LLGILARGCLGVQILRSLLWNGFNMSEAVVITRVRLVSRFCYHNFTFRLTWPLRLRTATFSYLGTSLSARISPNGRVFLLEAYLQTRRHGLNRGTIHGSSLSIHASTRILSTNLDLACAINSLSKAFYTSVRTYIAPPTRQGHCVRSCNCPAGLAVCGPPKESGKTLRRF